MRITTVLQVKSLKGSGRAIIWKRTEKGKASLLPQPALESVMEEKVAVGSSHSQKLKHSIWLFKLQLLRGHGVAAPPLLPAALLYLAVKKKYGSGK